MPPTPPTPVEARTILHRRSTESPAALRSGDISAFVYANAMGVELPSETNGNATRATINVRQVTSSYAGSDFDPIVTPDGQHLIFASTQHRPTADLYHQINRHGSVVTRLTDDPGTRCHAFDLTRWQVHHLCLGSLRIVGSLHHAFRRRQGGPTHQRQNSQ